MYDDDHHGEGARAHGLFADIEPAEFGDSPHQRLATWLIPRVEKMADWFFKRPWDNKPEDTGVLPVRTSRRRRRRPYVADDSQPGLPVMDGSGDDGGDDDDEQRPERMVIGQHLIDDAISALNHLGYKKALCRQLVDNAIANMDHHQDKPVAVEDIIREAMKKRRGDA